MEGRRMVAVNWLWMLLILTLCCTVSCIQIPTNRTTSPQNVSVMAGDSELSASERNRRLIPYMAFYLPAHEFPINQQYAVQRVKGAKNPQPLPIPSAYVRTKVTGSAGSGPVADQYSPYTGPGQYQGTAGDVYHALAYQQHPLPKGPMQQQPPPQHHHQPILHLLPPGPSGGGGSQGYTTTTGGIKTHKQKTVQHFPPTASPPQIVHSSSVAPIPPDAQQQRHPHHYRHHGSEHQQAPEHQQAKQSKFNLTPFTPSNTLPGHFVPIIYAPVSSPDNTNHINSNSYKDPHQTTAEDGPSHSHTQSQQQQQQHINKAYPQRPSPQIEYYESDVEAQLAPQSQSQSQAQPHSNKNQHTPKTQYIDYIIDEPKQSLDEEHHYQPAFVLVSTVAPPQQQQQYYISTARPPVRQQPTLRLHPVGGQTGVLRVSPAPSNGGYTSPKPYGRPLAHPKEVANRRPGITTLEPLTNRQHYQMTTKEMPVIVTTTERTRPEYHNTDDEEEMIVKQQQQYQETIDLSKLTTHERPHSHHLKDPNQLPDIRSSSLAEILHKLQETNHLPHTLTPDNIDNSIKTLVTILENLKQTQKIVTNPSQHHDKPSGHDYDYTNGNASDDDDDDVGGGNTNTDPDTDPRPAIHKGPHEDGHKEHHLNVVLPSPSEGPNKHPGPSTGRPGIDYPNYSEIPQTSFDCTEQRYKGFFGDPETNCQVWHYCDLNGGKASFLCPNGTIFSQIALTCDWWFNVKCSTTAQLYVLNERLYKYILPFTPKFPEDYSGPLVDKYLALKFQEMEEKMRLEKEKAAEAMRVAAESVDESTEDKDENLLKEAISQKAATAAPPALAKHITINSQVREQSSERNLLIDDEEDDVSHRAVSDKLPETTTSKGITTRATVPPPLSVRPIVVSSTTGPDYDDALSGEQSQRELPVRNAQKQQPPATRMTTYIASENAQHKETVQNLGHAKAKGTTKHLEPTEIESSKISVEKVEVIEIQTDGNTGHLMPSDMFERQERDVPAEAEANST